MAMESSAATRKAGGRSGYQWLTSGEHYMAEFVERFPEALLDRYLAVTSIDSGVPWLTERQAAAGWQRRGDCVYSSRLADTADLFFQRDGPGVPGYDEWYVYAEPAPDLGQRIHGNPFAYGNGPRPGHLLDFVNQLAFSIECEGDPLSQMFWKQLVRLQPESYLADGRDCLTFVTRNAALYERVSAVI